MLSIRIYLAIPALFVTFDGVAPLLAQQSPNVVLIYTDDQSWNSLSVHMDPTVPGSKSDFYQTPSLERLASEGMRFSNAYAALSACSPTRAALFTGKSPGQLGFGDVLVSTGVRGYTGHPLTPPLVKRLSPEEEGLAKRLQHVNPDYATGLVGKWHVTGTTPEQMGFDFYDTARGATPQDPKSTSRQTDAAIAFIDQSHANNQPFFLTLGYDAMHDPFVAAPETIAKYESLPPGTVHANATYAAMLEEVDRGIGRLLDRLDALELRDDTYVIFSSDHGAQHFTSNNAPFFRGKGHLFEGGIRVPLIVRGPGVAANSVSDVPVTTVDLFSTIDDLAGNDAPYAPGVEGASLKPLLFNEGQLPEGIEYLERTHAEDGALYFIMPSNIATSSSYRLRPMAAVRQGNYKLVRIFGELGNPDQNLLFDLSQSLLEAEFASSSLNRAQEEPEILTELTGKLDRWIQSADVNLPYSVDAPTIIDWRANHLGRTPNAWRAITDVQNRFRETWAEPESISQTPIQAEIQPFQRGLLNKAISFDGDDHLERRYFHVSEESERRSVRAFPTGEADFDRSVSFEFWVKFDDLNDHHILMESGRMNQGLSVTIGDADNDGKHSDARFRILGANGESITVTGNIADYADPTNDFIHLAVVYNDDPNDRYAQILANGHEVAKTQGLLGPDHSLYWDAFQQNFQDASLGNAPVAELGASGGSGDLPFSNAGLRGEISAMRFYNYAVDPQSILSVYNNALDPVALGLTGTSGDASVATSRPSSVALGSLETDQLLVIEERRDELSSDLSVDYLAAAGEPGVLPTGSSFTSYLLHFDPQGEDASSSESVSGHAVFEEMILGLILDSGSLADSDPLLGSIGDYGDAADRGIFLDENNSFSISNDGKTLFFDFSLAGDELLQFRVLTEEVEYLPTDFDFNSQVDAFDLTIWQSAFGTSADADTNHDGFSTGDDFLAWQRQFTGSEILDLADWLGGYGTGSLSADFNEDGVADGADFLAWQQQLTAASGIARNVAVPEPSAAMLLLMSLTGLLKRRTTRRH